MKNIFQKIATIIVIAISAVFSVVLFIMCLTIVKNVDALGGIFTNDRIGFTLLLVLGVIFVGLSVYLVASLFGGKANIKTMVLTSDSFSAVSTTNKVVRGVIKTCVNSMEGVKLLATKITEDDKPGFKLGLKIKINSGNVHYQTKKLKYLLEDSFKKELDFCFNSIIIKVASLKNAFEPDTNAADAYIKAKEEEQKCADACKIAEATPSEQTILQKNLTPQELSQIVRPTTEAKEQQTTDTSTQQDLDSTQKGQDENQKEDDNPIDVEEDVETKDITLTIEDASQDQEESKV